MIIGLDIMRRKHFHHLCIMLFVLLLTSIVGCGGSNTSKTGQNSQSPSQSQQQTIPTPVISYLSLANEMLVDNVDYAFGRHFYIYGVNLFSDAIVLIDGKQVETTYYNNNLLEASTNSVEVRNLGVHQVQVKTQGVLSNTVSYDMYHAAYGPQPFNVAEGLNYPNYYYIKGIGFGDFDGDGIGEIFAYSYNPYPNEFFIIKKDANGKLNIINHFATHYIFDFALTGDVNGDGLSDVVLLKSFNGGGGFTVLTNDGKGNLQEASTTNYLGGADRVSLEDITGDGRKDLLIHSRRGCGFNLATNMGGYFSKTDLISNESANCSYPDSYPWSSAADDYNGDGKRDLVYSSYDADSSTAKFKLLLQQGSGAFIETPLNLAGLPVFNANVTETVAAIDFNKDGFSDLAVQINDPSAGIYLNIYKNNRDGTFALASSNNIAQAPNLSLYRLSVGDFDQDGNMDMVGYKEIGIWSETSDINVLFLWGNGTGGFLPEKIINSAVSSLVVGDVDGDGLKDVAIGHSNGMVSVLPGSKTRNIPKHDYLVPNSGGQISAADANGDGYLDLMVSDDAHSVPGMIYINDKYGHFSQGISVPAAARIIADLDDDGKAELIGGDDSGLLVWPGTGDPTFPGTPIRTAMSYLPDQLAVFDVNQDGRLDIVCKDGAFILYALGNMTYSVHGTTGPYTNYVFGDFNNDGWMDYINESRLYLGAGSGLFKYAYNLGAIPGFNQPAAAADFNGDGILDLATVSSQILYGLGDGTFATSSYVDENIGNSIVTGDFNRDGMPDIIVLKDSYIAILVNDGKSHYQRSYITTGISSSKHMIQADFNNDSKLDIAISGDGGAEVFLNNFPDPKISTLKELNSNVLSWMPRIGAQYFPSKSKSININTNNKKRSIPILQPGLNDRLMNESRKMQAVSAEKESQTSAFLNLINIYSPRVGGSYVSLPAAAGLAEMLNTTGIVKASPVNHRLLLKASLTDSNRERELWGIAGKFQDYIKRHPISGDYALYADYDFNANDWKKGYVNFILCNKNGELVGVDMQNARSLDYQKIKPKSITGCNILLIKRLKHFLH